MRIKARALCLATTGALIALGGISAPVQAAPAARPVTSGHAQLSFDLPLPPGSISAIRPGRDTANGLFFPIASATGATIALAGKLALLAPTDTVAFPLKVQLDKAAKRASILVIPPTVEALEFFYSRDMKVSAPKVTVNKANKTRSTTTTWTGTLRLNGTNPELAANLNVLYDTTIFIPDGPVGQFALKVTVTAPCKNAKCTK
jgi:hypothetical protein